MQAAGKDLKEALEGTPSRAVIGYLLFSYVANSGKDTVFMLQ